MPAVSFQAVHEAALLRHGSEGVASRLPEVLGEAELHAIPADRYLSRMSQRMFRAGLKHSVVDARWPAFEQAFFSFDVERVAGLYDEQMEELLENKNLIRHAGKLMAVRHNARAMLDIGDFPGWIAGWPVTGITALWAELGKRMKQLGGDSAPRFLRMVGKDTFVMSPSVVAGLRYWEGFEGAGKSKADRAAVQAIMNRWVEESGLPIGHVSMILALSTDH